MSSPERRTNEGIEKTRRDFRVRGGTLIESIAHEVIAFREWPFHLTPFGPRLEKSPRGRSILWIDSMEYDGDDEVRYRQARNVSTFVWNTCYWDTRSSKSA
jgi:hypothetical protein